jgi:hypothetical protein
MSDSISKKVQIVSYILMGISVLLAVLFYTGAITEEPIIMWCYALVIAGTAAAIVFPILNIISNPKGAKSVLTGVVLLVVVGGLSYALAGDEVLPAYRNYGTTESSSKMVSTGLILFYLLAAGAVIATIYSEVSKMFK